ncbi:MAG: ArsR family transcriptional regulator [Anaerolineales bacterium]|nr:ArsR family transcriptional regulator [Anaerolineales bacterium]
MALPTRLRILEYLRTHQTATAAELSAALRMTCSNLRHHLAILVSNDLIEVLGRRREGRGRPERIFGLSRRVLGDGLDMLSGLLLEEWLATASPAERAASLRRMAVRLAGGGPGSGPLPQRLNAVVQRLNDLHYQARWEAGPAGPRLILGHCPYGAIIDGHPELCRLDALMLEERVGLPALQQAKLERKARGGRQCIFRISRT